MNKPKCRYSDDGTNPTLINIYKYFTTNEKNGFIHVKKESATRLKDLECEYEKFKKEVIAIIVSGWSMNKKEFNRSDNCRLYRILYSSHSSCQELCDAVKVINPRIIIPNVSNTLLKAPPFITDKMSLKNPDFVIPPIIQDVLAGKRTYITICTQHMSPKNHIRNSQRVKKASLLANREDKNRRKLKFNHSKGSTNNEITNVEHQFINAIFVETLSISHIIQNEENFSVDGSSGIFVASPTKSVVSSASSVTPHTSPIKYTEREFSDENYSNNKENINPRNQANKKNLEPMKTDMSPLSQIVSQHETIEERTQLMGVSNIHFTMQKEQLLMLPPKKKRKLSVMSPHRQRNINPQFEECASTDNPIDIYKLLDLC